MISVHHESAPRYQIAQCDRIALSIASDRSRDLTARAHRRCCARRRLV